MGRQEKSEILLILATVVMGGFLIAHFVLGHRDASGRPDGSVGTATTPSESWPPAPDSAALRDLRLPRAVPVEFYADTLRSRLTTLDYRGHLRLDAGGLELSFHPRAQVAVTIGYPRALALRAVSLGLAEPGPAGWRIVAEGPRDERPAHFQGGVLFPPPVLRLPDVGAVDLAGRWPVVIHAVDIDDPVDLEQSRMEVYLHGTRRMTDDLLAPGPAEAGR